MNRSRSAFRWAVFAVMPSALGIRLPSLGVVDSKLLLAALGMVAGFIAMRRVRHVEGDTTTRLRPMIVLSMLANGLVLIEPWSSKLSWLSWTSTAVGFAGLIAYLLLARVGIAIARSKGDSSLERSWRRCAWIGLPLFVFSSLFLLVWWVVSGFRHQLHFESHNLLVMMGITLVVALPAILLFQALFATEKAISAALGTKVRPLVTMFAHPITIVVLVLLFLTPSLMMVPDAIHYAVTPNFNQFVARSPGTLSFNMPSGMRVLDRHTGLLYTSGSWVDNFMEPRQPPAEHIGYELSVELTRPGDTLLSLTNSFEIKVDPPTSEDSSEFRVATEMGPPLPQDFVEFRVVNHPKTIDPRFHLALTVFLLHRISGSEAATAAHPVLEFVVRVALMAGPSDTVLETLWVDDLPSILTPPKDVPSLLVPAGMNAQAQSYLWKAWGKFEILPHCFGPQCLDSRVRYEASQRFAIATEEYSYASKATLTIYLQAKGTGAQYRTTGNSNSDNQSKEVSWNGVPW